LYLSSTASCVGEAGVCVTVGIVSSDESIIILYTFKKKEKTKKERVKKKEKRGGKINNSLFK
jgi:hypothetical protein